MKTHDIPDCRDLLPAPKVTGQRLTCRDCGNAWISVERAGDLTWLLLGVNVSAPVAAEVA